MDDELGAAVAAALAPYAWRELTEPMLARLVVGAVRHSVIHFLTTVPGTDVAGVPPTEPAEAGDERVDAVRWMRGGLSGRRSSRTCGDCSTTTSRANLPGWPRPEMSRRLSMRCVMRGTMAGVPEVSR